MIERWYINMDKTNENILTAILGFATVIGTAIVCSKVRKTIKECDDNYIKSIEKEPTLNMANNNPRVDAYKLISERYSPTKYDQTFDAMDRLEREELALLKEDIITLKDTALKTIAVPDENGDMSSIYNMAVVVNNDIIDTRVTLMEILANAYNECEDDDTEEEDEYEEEYDEEEDDYEEEYDEDDYSAECYDPNCNCSYNRQASPMSSINWTPPTGNAYTYASTRPFAFDALFKQVQKNESDERVVEEETPTPTAKVEYQFDPQDPSVMEDPKIISKSFADSPVPPVMEKVEVEIDTSGISEELREELTENEETPEEITEGIVLDASSEKPEPEPSVIENVPEEEPEHNIIEDLNEFSRRADQDIRRVVRELQSFPRKEDLIKEQIENADGDAEEKKEATGMMFALKIPKNYIEKQLQENGTYRVELLNKDITGKFTGMIYWGDECKEPFNTSETTSLSHEYKKLKNRIIKFVITGGDNMISDTILNPDLKGTIINSMMLSENALVEMKLIKK